LDFYTRVIGMQLISKLDFKEMNFSLYFLGFHSEDDIPDDPKDRASNCAHAPSVPSAGFFHLTDCILLYVGDVQVEWMFKQPASGCSFSAVVLSCAMTRCAALAVK
jgi:catechol 2,3-dioxygenase-like lactoylglutathione lyase family enzyme